MKDPKPSRPMDASDLSLDVQCPKGPFGVGLLTSRILRSLDLPKVRARSRSLLRRNSTLTNLLQPRPAQGKDKNPEEDDGGFSSVLKRKTISCPSGDEGEDLYATGAAIQRLFNPELATTDQVINKTRPEGNPEIVRKESPSGNITGNIQVNAGERVGEITGEKPETTKVGVAANTSGDNSHEGTLPSDTSSGVSSMDGDTLSCRNSLEGQPCNSVRNSPSDSGRESTEEKSPKSQDQSLDDSITEFSLGKAVSGGTKERQSSYQAKDMLVVRESRSSNSDNALHKKTKKRHKLLIDSKKRSKTQPPTFMDCHDDIIGDGGELCLDDLVVIDKKSNKSRYKRLKNLGRKKKKKLSNEHKSLFPQFPEKDGLYAGVPLPGVQLVDDLLLYGRCGVNRKNSSSLCPKVDGRSISCHTSGGRMRRAAKNGMMAPGHHDNGPVSTQVI